MSYQNFRRFQTTNTPRRVVEKEVQEGRSLKDLGPKKQRSNGKEKSYKDLKRAFTWAIKTSADFEHIKMYDGEGMQKENH